MINVMYSFPEQPVFYWDPKLKVAPDVLDIIGRPRYCVFLNFVTLLMLRLFRPEFRELSQLQGLVEWDPKMMLARA
ncbi:unnamed protein product [Allacma fusca]|uniref:Uncharacterized protein n=1 Tax=Allacma fusca TaxID=39272 RepID=A0A8J2PJJ1_9HEXA|nr:unnamed protein product [Allacma fusca]